MTDLAALLARVRDVVKMGEKATPGPWLVFNQDHEAGQAYIEQDMAPTGHSQGYADPIVYGSACERKSDLPLIVALRNILPDLSALADAVEKKSRPEKILAWAIDTFGPVAGDKMERAMRFVEEAVELAHARFMGRETVLAIIDRVYSRPPGDLAREIGQAMLTLEALAEEADIDADHEAGREFDRVRSIPKEEWTRRHAAKTALGITADRTLTQQEK